MIFYIENPKDATRETLELINAFGKAARCKINIQKCVAFLYTNNEYQKEKLRKQSHLQSHQSWKKQESSRKTSISALLTMPKPWTVWITINCGKF